MSKEYRSGPITNVRANGSKPQFTARVCNYGVPDSYRTSWAPGVFKRALGEKLPTAVWSHNWDRPIGKVIEFNDGPEGLDVTVEMADLNDVPDARMAYSLLRDGIISQFSFAFDGKRALSEDDPVHEGVRMFTEASLDEISPVLMGAVPGTKTLAVRSDGQLPRAVAADILLKFGNGDMDLADALMAIKRGAVIEATAPAPGPGVPTPTPTPPPVPPTPTPTNPTPPPGEPRPSDQPAPTFTPPEPDEELDNAAAALDKLLS